MNKEQILYDAIAALDGASGDKIAAFRFNLTDDITIAIRCSRDGHDLIYYAVQIDDAGDITHFNFGVNVGYEDEKTYNLIICQNWLKSTVYNLCTRV